MMPEVGIFCVYLNFQKRFAMKRTTIINALICAVVSMSIISCENSKVYDVRLSGEGVDLFPDSSRVLVFHKGADIRFDEPVASAVIDGGSFHLSFRDSVLRQYELMFEEDIMDGSFQFFNFFSDRVPIHFNFGSKYGDLTVEVDGSRDNEELYLYRNKSTEGYDLADSMYYEIDKWILDRYGEDGWPEEGSEDYRTVQDMYDRAGAVRDSIREHSGYEEWVRDRLVSHRTLAGLSKICSSIRLDVQEMKMGHQDTLSSFYLGLFEEYRRLYPDNELTLATDALLSDLERIAPGRPAPDFSAPSLDGQRYRLSELLKGNAVTVLDCWASWCGSCRKHSRELIPLYEKYRDRGMAVVGVAREYDSLDDMCAAVEKDGYPWIQLYDLDGAEGIWNLYGLSTAGGGIFLIDSEGNLIDKFDDTAAIAAWLEANL